MPRSPAVSIVIPAYKPYYFAACLESALRQDYSNTNVIVCDDCPGDHISQICRKYSAVRYVKNSSSGYYKNLDLCLQSADGEIVKFLFDDDLLAVDCISEFVNAYLANVASDIGLIASSYILVDESGSHIGDRGLNVNSEVSLIHPIAVIRGMVSHIRNYVGGLSAVAIDRHTLVGLGERYFSNRLDGGWRGLSDVALYFDLAKYGSTLYINRPLVSIRRNPHSLSNPDINPNLKLSATAWRTGIEEAIAIGALDSSNIKESYINLIILYKSYIAIYPELIDEVNELERISQG